MMAGHAGTGMSNEKASLGWHRTEGSVRRQWSNYLRAAEIGAYERELLTLTPR